MVRCGSHSSQHVASIDTRESHQHPLSQADSGAALNRLDTMVRAEKAMDGTSMLQKQLQEVKLQLEEARETVRALSRASRDKDLEIQQLKQQSSTDSAPSETQASIAPAAGDQRQQRSWEAEVCLLQEQHEKSLHAALQQACAALEAAHEEERRMWSEEQERERCRASAENMAERQRLEEQNSRVRLKHVLGCVASVPYSSSLFSQPPFPPLRRSALALGAAFTSSPVECLCL